jgi:hypothetical protein
MKPSTVWNLKVSWRWRWQCYCFMTPSGFVGRYRRFGGTYCLHLQDWSCNVKHAKLVEHPLICTRLHVGRFQKAVIFRVRLLRTDISANRQEVYWQSILNNMKACSRHMGVSKQYVISARNVSNNTPSCGETSHSDADPLVLDPSGELVPSHVVAT